MLKPAPVTRTYRLDERFIGKLAEIRDVLAARAPSGLAGTISLTDALKFSIATAHTHITGTAAGTINPLVGAATGVHVPFTGAVADPETLPAEDNPSKPGSRSRQPRKSG